MKRILEATCAIFMLGALVAWAQPAQTAAIPQQGRTVQVQVRYTGSGKVDDGHKIYVALWDTSDFASPGYNSPPVALQSTNSKDGMVVFSNVQKVPAYVSAAFDPTGEWDAQSNPPAGSSLGMVSKAPPKPDAINVAPGQTAKVTLTFNDSVKVGQ
jgi:hypothetical protein